MKIQGHGVFWYTREWSEICAHASYFTEIIYLSKSVFIRLLERVGRDRILGYIVTLSKQRKILCELDLVAAI